MRHTLVWGVVVALGIGLMVGCAGARNGAGAKAGEAVVGASEVTAPDYATRLAMWVDGHQDDPGARNEWAEFGDVVTQAAASWTYFAAADGPIREFVARDPEKNFGAADPLGALAGEQPSFVPEVRRFFAGLDRTRIPSRLDGLAEARRFVAARPVEGIVEALMPELGTARLASKLCVARMHLAALDGDAAWVERAVNHNGAIGRAVQGRGNAIGALLGYTVQTTMDEWIGREILDGRLKGEPCAAAQRGLAACTLPSPVVYMGGERFCALDVIEQYFQTVKEDPSVPKSAAAQNAVDKGLGVMMSRDEQSAMANELFDAYAAMFSADEAERARGEARSREIEARIESKSSKRASPLDIALPAVAKMRSVDRKARTRHDGTLVMLALERFRARTGKYPAGLEELAPLEMERVPEDRYAGAGSLLRYRLTDSASGCAGEAYVLYSVGFDGVDDGGALCPRGNVNSTGPVGKGSDYLLNRWN